MTDVDANRIIENLSFRIGQLTAENAVLQAQLETLIAARAEEAEQEDKDGNSTQDS